MSPPKKKHVVSFTYYSDDLLSSPKRLMEECTSQRGQSITHLRYSLERCPDTLRVHCQGTARCSTANTVTAWKSLLASIGAPGAHIELAKGTWQQNLSYTSKSQTHLLGPFDYAVDGNINSPESGSTDDFHRFVVVCCGPPKIGKTYIWKIIASYIGSVYLVPGRAKNSTGRWIGNYSGQDCAIVDEFDYYNDFTTDQWKMLLDVAPHEIPTSAGGKSVMWTPTLVVLLSNLSSSQVRKHPFNVDPVFVYRIAEISFWYTLVCPVYLRKRKFYILDTTTDEFAPATTPNTFENILITNFDAQISTSFFYTGLSFP